MAKRLVSCLMVYGLVIFFMTGCWDEMNIEERNFVVGSALDVADKKERQDMTISLTDQFVIPGGIGPPEGGESADKTYTNETAKGKNPQVLSHYIASGTSRKPSYQHLKILVFSEELAKQPNMIPKLSDMFMRDVDMRRGVKVFIAEDKAKDILEMEQDTEQTPTRFVNMLFEKNDGSIETINSLRIGILQEFLLRENSYVLPRLTLENEELNTNSAAVFHGPDNKLVGSLNARETKGYNLATQTTKEGMVEMNVDDERMVYKIADTRSKMTLNVDDPHHVEAYIDVKAEGFLGEMFGSESVINANYLKKIGNKAADKMEKLIKETIKKSQEELHADILGVGGEMKRKHYNVWKKLHNDWEGGENYFDNVTFHVKVDAKMIDVGSTDRTKQN